MLPCSHRLVKRATRTSSVPTRDVTYQSTARIVTITVQHMMRGSKARPPLAGWGLSPPPRERDSLRRPTCPYLTEVAAVRCYFLLLRSNSAARRSLVGATSTNGPLYEVAASSVDSKLWYLLQLVRTKIVVRHSNIGPVSPSANLRTLSYLAPRFVAAPLEMTP